MLFCTPLAIYMLNIFELQSIFLQHVLSYHFMKNLIFIQETGPIQLNKNDFDDFLIFYNGRNGPGIARHLGPVHVLDNSRTWQLIRRHSTIYG